MKPNATLQARPIAGARDERRLSGVACKRLLGPVPVPGDLGKRVLTLFNSRAPLSPQTKLLYSVSAVEPINHTGLVELADKAIFDQILDPQVEHFGIMECHNSLHVSKALDGRVRLAVKVGQILIAPLGGGQVGEIE